MTPSVIRTGSATDRTLLAAMLYEAFSCNPSQPRADFDVLSRNSEFTK